MSDRARVTRRRHPCTTAAAAPRSAHRWRVDHGLATRDHTGRDPGAVRTLSVGRIAGPCTRTRRRTRPTRDRSTTEGTTWHPLPPPVRPGGPTGPQRRSVMGGGANGNRPTGVRPGRRHPAPDDADRPPAGGGRHAAGGARSGGTAAGGPRHGRHRRSRPARPRRGAGAATAARRPATTSVIDYPRQGKTRHPPLAAVVAPDPRHVRHRRPAGRRCVVVDLVLPGRDPDAVGLRRVPDDHRLLLRRRDARWARSRSRTAPSSAGETIPQHVKDAVVAAEDRSFYENPGINPAGIARALYLNVTGKDQQGGSSITQQYAERYYIGETVERHPRARSRRRCSRSSWPRVQDKDQILTNYLNTIYFGRDSYGIEAAARAYFGVGVADLDGLAGRADRRRHPVARTTSTRAISPEQAERRWNYVLDGMVDDGRPDPGRARRPGASRRPSSSPRSDVYAGPDGLPARHGRAASSSPSGDHRRRSSTSAGYRIVTTIDAGLQQMAVERGRGDPRRPRARTCASALVTLEPGDGAIRALYGGPDYLTQSHATPSRRTAPRRARRSSPSRSSPTSRPADSLQARATTATRTSRSTATRPTRVRNFGAGTAELRRDRRASRRRPTRSTPCTRR